MSARRPPGPGGRSATPAMAGRTVIVVLIAVALGLLILRNGFGDTSGGESAATTTTTPSTTAATETTSTTVLDKASCTVVVANAAGVAGSAGRTTEALAALGYTMLEATNANITGQAETQVYYQPGSESCAGLVAGDLGLTAPAGPLPQPSPVDNVGDADVVVVLGRDIAIGGVPAPATTAPAAGGETTTTATG